MTNHVHFLMTPATKHGIGHVMQTIGRSYVTYFNRMHERTGGLWEGRYRAMRIDNERYLLSCYRYIELNPVRAGLVTDPGRYPWSSYGANAMGVRDPLVTPHERYLAPGISRGERTTVYRALFSQQLDERTLFSLRRGRRRELALNSERGLTLGSDPGV